MKSSDIVKALPTPTNPDDDNNDSLEKKITQGIKNLLTKDREPNNAYQKLIIHIEQLISKLDVFRSKLEETLNIAYKAASNPGYFYQIMEFIPDNITQKVGLGGFSLTMSKVQTQNQLTIIELSYANKLRCDLKELKYDIISEGEKIMPSGASALIYYYSTVSKEYKEEINSKGLNSYLFSTPFENLIYDATQIFKEYYSSQIKKVEEIEKTINANLNPPVQVEKTEDDKKVITSYLKPH